MSSVRPHTPQPCVSLLLGGIVVLGLLTASGCGDAKVGSGGGSTVAKIKVAVTSIPASTTSSTPAPAPKPAPNNRAVAQIDASSDKVLAEGKVHIASGAPSDAEVKRELRAARKAGIVLPSGESAASFERAASSSGGPVADVETPEAAWNPRSKPIATWIIPILEWAVEHGWKGTVTSGFRTFYEQAQLNAAGDFSAPAGLSNHETSKYPGGAVDVTNPSQLIEVLRSYPGPVKLVGGVLGPVDPEHFSATGD
jgi:hypothetical protein